jgi:hypothetical protein
MQNALVNCFPLLFNHAGSGRGDPRGGHHHHWRGPTSNVGCTGERGVCVMNAFLLTVLNKFEERREKYVFG